MPMKNRASFLVTLLAGIAVTAIATAGTALAKPAPDVTGTKFSDAKKALSDAGFKVVVITRIGARVSADDCVVSHQQVHPVPVKSKSNEFANNKVRISLNCYPPKQGSEAAEPASGESQQ